jgi:hypothetical protein
MEKHIKKTCHKTSFSDREVSHWSTTSGFEPWTRGRLIVSFRTIVLYSKHVLQLTFESVWYGKSHTNTILLPQRNDTYTTVVVVATVVVVVATVVVVVVSVVVVATVVVVVATVVVVVTTVVVVVATVVVVVATVVVVVVSVVVVATVVVVVATVVVVVATVVVVVVSVVVVATVVVVLYISEKIENHSYLHSHSENIHPGPSFHYFSFQSTKPILSSHI